MSDVFLSYAHEDHAAAAGIARRLEQRGWSVFWDRTSLLPGQEFARVIEEELARASCVVVLWSRSSAAARWVRAEAGAAVERDVAVPVLLEEVALPLLFRQVLAADLRGWDGEGSHPGLERLLGAVEHRIAGGREAPGGGAVPSSAPDATRRPGRGDPSGERPRPDGRRWGPGVRRAALAAAGLLVVLAALWRWSPWEGAATPGAGTDAPTPTPRGRAGAERGPANPPATEGELFTLEVLDASHGECYVLHYGSGSSPRFALFDGGRAPTYRTVLRPRLEQLRRTWSRGRSLRLDLVAASQIDDHRVAGILELVRELRAAAEEGLEPLFAIERLWFNGFEVPAAAPSARGGPPPSDRPLPAVLRSGPGWRLVPAVPLLASVRQGQTLLGEARALGLELNRPFDRLVMRPERGVARVELEGGLVVTVLGPARRHVLALFDLWVDQMVRSGQLSGAGAALLRSRRDEWTTERFSDPALELSAARRPAGPPALPVPPRAIAPAAYEDESVANLASLVLLLEKAGKRVLMTGDARGDHVLEGLRQAGLLPADGTVRFDVLQVPHQGSDRSVEPAFFTTVLADVYVINGNGRHGNPETATLRMITEARGDAEYALYFTHPDGEEQLRARLEGFFDAERSLDRRYEVRFRARESTSMRINLLGAVRY